MIVKTWADTKVIFLNSCVLIHDRCFFHRCSPNWSGNGFRYSFRCLFYNWLLPITALMWCGYIPPRVRCQVSYIWPLKNRQLINLCAMSSDEHKFNLTNYLFYDLFKFLRVKVYWPIFALSISLLKMRVLFADFFPCDTFSWTFLNKPHELCGDIPLTLQLVKIGRYVLVSNELKLVNRLITQSLDVAHTCG